MSSKSPFDLDKFLPYQLAVLASRTSRSLAQIYTRDFGISIPEWRVLAHLSMSDNVSIRDINTRVDMDKSKVTRAVQRLEAANLVEKQQNGQDKRLIVLTLTEEGRNLMASLAPKADSFAEAMLDGLEPETRRVFQSAVEQLIKTSEEKTR